ncbi:MAG TPA: patatin-like phospholipase family protein [Allosphingosinicella sp.]|jgi:predicted acylesterase/phospholipase RssA
MATQAEGTAVPAKGTRPDLECDLIMKGGITSGVVYPGAIAQIADGYRLRAIGGTSAGAIAAAAAAAMEFGRASGLNGGARDRLADVPARLGAATADGTPLLTQLFQPDPGTAPLLAPILDMMRPGFRARLRGALSLLGLPLAGAAVGAAGLLYASGLRQVPPGIVAKSALAIVALVLVAALLVPLLWLLRIRRPLAALAEDFGFCSGMTAARSRDDPPLPSLTEWLHTEIQALAGLPSSEPLTFADLWTADKRAGGASRDAAIQAALADLQAPIEDVGLAGCRREIDLALVASDMSRSLSVQFPFVPGGARLYARRTDLDALFPADVVQWMEQRAAPTEAGDLEGVTLDGKAARDLVLPLPRPEDMPIVFAARVSMSFPLLFKAVRLYLLHYRSERRGGGKELLELWLADGGITSNFPVHLFDSPISTRPTFCLNLLYPGDEVHSAGGGDAAGESARPADGASSDPEADHIRMARTNRAELLLLHEVSRGSSLSRLIGWGGRILFTARQWSDIALMNVPGYRDRIVHIRMLPGEGGLNLAMSQATVRRLDSRGRLAGRVIGERFRPGCTTDPLYGGELKLNWSNHRFVRFRSFIAALEVSVAHFVGGWRKDESSRPSVDEMIDRTAAGTPAPYVGYVFTGNPQRALARDMVSSIEALHDLADRTGSSVDFTSTRHTSPRPKAVLSVRPPLADDPRSEF